MLCSICGADRVPREGRCPSCGNKLDSNPSLGKSGTGRYAEAHLELSRYTPVRGDVLGKGRYRLLSQVQLPELQRSFGNAWEATDNTSHSRVVIRDIHVPAQLNEPASSLDQTIAPLIQRLIDLGQHPSLPKVIDCFKEQGTFYFVFTHIDGKSLAATLLSEQGSVALRERTVTAYGCTLCEIVSFFSRQQPPFVHGSICPETVIIHPNGRDVSLIYLPLFPYETQVNKSKGSPSYLAPEQVRGVSNTSSDLYGVAATLYHAVTSSRPSDRIAFFYPPARRLNPAVTSGMEAILIRQLHMAVAQRYPRAEEMQKDLSSLLASYPEDTGEQEQPVLFTDPARLSLQERQEMSGNGNLLNIGVFVAVMILIIVGIVFAIVR